ncbi:hypothetical protein HYH03_001748 [Edaphochlamys debaryana]|uniref:Ankyrin repeat domain-containing protein n=1 Tax=Edaphochlamys debaryana TaxID=47281 RepID=A0A835YFV3_9CHLO|nr:hypothetical protein HYH03_001748 [Edaphochlamys debaryana]|eukprot:KAG2500166.1 hypothetical protein HYH03_001748 [Edaphochlamys debaryana]
MKLSRHDASSVWQQDLVVHRIFSFLPPNYGVCTLPLVNKSSGATLDCLAVKVSDGVPGWAVIAQLARKRAELTLRQRRKLVGAVAAYGDVDWLERAVEAAGCSLTAEVMAAAARAGKLECCQRLQQLGCPFKDGGTDSLASAATAGQREACEWLLANGAECSREAASAAAQSGDAELMRFFWSRHPPSEPLSRESACWRLVAVARGCDLATLKDVWGTLVAMLCAADYDRGYVIPQLLAVLWASAAGSPRPDWQAKLEWAEELEAAAVAAGEAWETSPCRAAAYTGAAQCPGPEAVARMQWLRRRGYLVPPSCAAAEEAASCGNLPAYAYLRQQGASPPARPVEVSPPPGVSLAEALPGLLKAGCPVDLQNTAHRAIMRGDKAGLEWMLHKLGAGAFKYHLLVIDAARSGRVDLLELLWDRDPAVGPAGARLGPDGAQLGALERKQWTWSGLWPFASAAGSVAALEWLRDKGCARDGATDCQAYVAAARNGDYLTLRALKHLGARVEAVSDEEALELVEEAEAFATEFGMGACSYTALPLELMLMLGCGLTGDMLRRAVGRTELDEAKREALLARIEDLDAWCFFDSESPIATAPSRAARIMLAPVET